MATTTKDANFQEFLTTNSYRFWEKFERKINLKCSSIRLRISRRAVAYNKRIHYIKGYVLILEILLYTVPNLQQIMGYKAFFKCKLREKTKSIFIIIIFQVQAKKNVTNALIDNTLYQMIMQSNIIILS